MLFCSNAVNANSLAKVAKLSGKLAEEPFSICRTEAGKSVCRVVNQCADQILHKSSNGLID